MPKILIVEDDKHILTGLVDNLTMEGYKTIIARDGREALAQAKDKSPDLIILDIMLPKLNGLEVCKELRARGMNIPIIILSARAQESDKILGLELGADDYVTKPFSPRELLTRVKAVLRRIETAGKVEDIFSFGDVTVDFKKFQAFKKGKEGKIGGEKGTEEKGLSSRDPEALDSSSRGGAAGADEAISNKRVEINLTAGECKILKLLISSLGEPVSRHKILAEIWTDENVTTRTVDTHICNLRDKLEDDPANPKHIITVHRIGYKFV
ncbi:MAG: response regulator transcription factor [Candidatus Omnitrophota bacterium]|nr:response regulator transcription factor [Candidatus Omnitrophota bacterium]